MNGVSSFQRDFFAVWDAVFDRVNPTEGAPAGPMHAREQQGDGCRGGSRWEMCWASLAESIEPRATQVSAPLNAPTFSASAVSRAAPNCEAQAGAQISPKGAAATVASVAVRSTVEPAVQRAGVATHVQQVPVGPTTDTDTDSVIVIVQDTEVSIVVRDGAVSDHHAIRTAFAAAAELTGRRDALVQLTLNGRTLYRQLAATDAALPQQRLPKIII